MTYAVILSGGTGSRLGLEIPKQYHKVKEKPIFWYGLKTLEKLPDIHGIVIVAAEEWRAFILSYMGSNSKFIGFADPGENRQLSIYHGLEVLENMAAEEDVVLIQDAARPNTSEALIRTCVRLAPEEDGRMPVLPMKDTVYMSENGKGVSRLLPRSQVFAGQAPEAFRYGKYLRANRMLLPERILRINGSTEPAIMAGMEIAMIAGEEKNYKITTMADLEQFCRNIEDNRA